MLANIVGNFAGVFWWV